MVACTLKGRPCMFPSGLYRPEREIAHGYLHPTPDLLTRSFDLRGDTKTPRAALIGGEHDIIPPENRQERAFHSLDGLER